jgi:dipeptidyl aminopeptidase/acylaminoacyl peptidase
VLVRELNLFGTLCRNAWSPDATRVVWHCFTDETFTVIHVASGETRTVVLSMPGLEKVTDLDWSFRGELAVAGLTKLGGEVWVADIDKVTAERLAVENKVVVAVRWNARGTRVYYSRLKPSRRPGCASPEYVFIAPASSKLSACPRRAARLSGSV